MLYYIILYYTILYCTVLYCTVLYYTMLCYALLYYTILYYTIQYTTILYYTILYYTILYYSILCYTILYSAMYCIIFCNGGYGTQSFQEDGFGIPSHDMILCCIQLIYTILRYNVQWRWHPMPCKKLDLASHLTI